MANFPTISREYRIYLAIWRKAYLERDSGKPPVTVQASSLSTALTMRRGMYRAIRPFRNGEQFDEELMKASENFVISMPTQDSSNSKHFLILKPRTSLSELEAELASLGLDEEDLKLTMEKQTIGKLSEFLDEAAPMPRHSSNPFYTREG